MPCAVAPPPPELPPPFSPELAQQRATTSAPTRAPRTPQAPQPPLPRLTITQSGSATRTVSMFRLQPRANVEMSLRQLRAACFRSNEDDSKQGLHLGRPRTPNKSSSQVVIETLDGTPPMRIRRKSSTPVLGSGHNDLDAGLRR